LKEEEATRKNPKARVQNSFSTFSMFKKIFKSQKKAMQKLFLNRHVKHEK